MTGKCTEKNLPNSVPAKLGEGLKGRRARYSIWHYEINNQKWACANPMEAQSTGQRKYLPDALVYPRVILYLSRCRNSSFYKSGAPWCLPGSRKPSGWRCGGTAWPSFLQQSNHWTQSQQNLRCFVPAFCSGTELSFCLCPLYTWSHTPMY